jgi:hypothetical protein
MRKQVRKFRKVRKTLKEMLGLMAWVVATLEEARDKLLIIQAENCEQIRQLQSQNRELDGDIAFIGQTVTEAKKLVETY